ncbi:hypothetical protein R3P38DRAFT_736930, partial [Favolaschia claudopus]
ACFQPCYIFVRTRIAPRARYNASSPLRQPFTVNYNARNQGIRATEAQSSWNAYIERLDLLPLRLSLFQPTYQQPGVAPNYVLSLPFTICLSLSPMAPVRTLRTKRQKENIPIRIQIMIAIYNIWYMCLCFDTSQIILFADIVLECRRNATIYNRWIMGPRFEMFLEKIIRAMHRRGYVDADFERSFLKLTLEGQQVLTHIDLEVGVAHIDDKKAELGALFSATPHFLEPIKPRTNLELERLNDQQEARIKTLQREIAAGFDARDAEIEELQEELRVLHELSLPSPTATTEVIRQTVDSNEAGPSTPIRRTASMLANEGQLPTPISVLRRPEVIRNRPSSSPSPQPSFDMTMDVDDNELVQPGFNEPPHHDNPLPMPRGVEELDEMIASLEEQLGQAQDQLALLQAQERMNQATIEENRFTLEQYRTMKEEQRITIERQEEEIAGYKKRIAFYEAIGEQTAEQFQIAKTL